MFRRKIRSYYDKIHMYDVVLSKREKYFESKTFLAGNKIKTSHLPWGKLGLSICYDLRFPNLYRKLAKDGSIFLSVPSAFTETTGKRHWHALLRARAIENFCYIFAPGVSLYRNWIRGISFDEPGSSTYEAKHDEQCEGYFACTSRATDG